MYVVADYIAEGSSGCQKTSSVYYEVKTVLWQILARPSLERDYVSWSRRCNHIGFVVERLTGLASPRMGGG